MLRPRSANPPDTSDPSGEDDSVHAAVRTADEVRYRGDHAGPAAFHRSALDLRPDRAAALLKLAACLHDEGRLSEALSAYRTAAEIQPDLAEAHYNAGLIQQSAGRLSEAEVFYRKALQAKPDFAEALNNLGQVHLTGRRVEQALACFQKAARLKPDAAEPHFNLGKVFQDARRPAEAIAHYRTAVQLRPAMVEAWNNLGTALKDQGDLPGAIECYRRVTALRPDLAEGQYNLGSALKDTGDHPGAVAVLERALVLRRDYPEAWNNLGLVEKARARYEQSIHCFSQALQLKPEMAEARWNRAFVHLLTGNFACGWQDFEARHELPQWKLFYPFRPLSPRWDGSPLSSGSILVHDEQGLGDTLQFVRYLPKVKERCARVVLETQAPLVHLLKDLPGVDAVTERPATAPHRSMADAHIPLMSLPRIFGTMADSIPAVVPYIWPDLEKARAWSGRISGPGLNVGLAWAGRPEHHNDRNRSCRLEQFAALARIPGMRFFSLQKGPAARQIHQAGLQEAVVDLDPELKDFTDTAAAAANLDLVITVDTSVAHLAGAMARPVWVLLPFVPDWRWMLDRDDSPWYPSMHLFRQEKPGEWESVFRRVEAALRRRSTGICETAGN
jgi:tetratricopeptide (TPR) repeat protein